MKDMGSHIGHSVIPSMLKQTSVIIATLITPGLYLWHSSPGSANPAPIHLAEITAPSIQAIQPQPSLLNQALATATPSLPPLGDADLFLPAPEAILRLVIRLSDRRVYVYEQDQIVESYPIAIGRAGWETPTGEFEVIQMLRHPVWEHPFTGELVPPGADNPLGSRWIGFWTDGTNYIGFHGTPNTETVGQAASHGCIRMYDQDVIALFEIVQMGTPVEVVP
jgi:lipoprotein-anchoring transpeptidase ErfK/SrfK